LRATDGVSRSAKNVRYLVVNRGGRVATRELVENVFLSTCMRSQERDEFFDSRLTGSVKVEGHAEHRDELTNLAVLGPYASHFQRVTRLDERKQVSLFRSHVTREATLELRPCGLKRRAARGCRGVVRDGLQESIELVVIPHKSRPNRIHGAARLFGALRTVSTGTEQSRTTFSATLPIRTRSKP
jgi:hypothetical protein